MHCWVAACFEGSLGVLVVPATSSICAAREGLLELLWLWHKQASKQAIKQASIIIKFDPHHVWGASLITCAETYHRTAGWSFLDLHCVMPSSTECLWCISHFVTHYSHLITRSRAAKFQTSTLNVWYSAKHTARAAWWTMGFVRLISQVRSRSMGEQSQAHSKSQVALTFWLCELVRVPARLSRMAPPSTCAARARIPEQPSHKINCHMFFLKLGTEQHKAGISQSSTQPSTQKLDEYWYPAKHIKAGAACSLTTREHGTGQHA
jgi:hypothetical protein